jgi:hypothetical protein
MTHTTTRQGIHLPAQRISSLLGNFGKRPLRWIYLYWIMLSLVDAVLIHSVAGTIASERLGYFEKCT